MPESLFPNAHSTAPVAEPAPAPAPRGLSDDGAALAYLTRYRDSMLALHVACRDLESDVQRPGTPSRADSILGDNNRDVSRLANALAAGAALDATERECVWSYGSYSLLDQLLALHAAMVRAYDGRADEDDDYLDGYLADGERAALDALASLNALAAIVARSMLARLPGRPARAGRGSERELD